MVGPVDGPGLSHDEVGDLFCFGLVIAGFVWFLFCPAGAGRPTSASVEKRNFLCRGLEER